MTPRWLLLKAPGQKHTGCKFGSLMIEFDELYLCDPASHPKSAETPPPCFQRELDEGWMKVGRMMDAWMDEWVHLCVCIFGAEGNLCSAPGRLQSLPPCLPPIGLQHVPSPSPSLQSISLQWSEHSTAAQPLEYQSMLPWRQRQTPSARLLWFFTACGSRTQENAPALDNYANANARCPSIALKSKIKSFLRTIALKLASTTALPMCPSTNQSQALFERMLSHHPVLTPSNC